MSEPKDLTQLAEFSQSTGESTAPGPSEPHEAIDRFETIEELSLNSTPASSGDPIELTPPQGLESPLSEPTPEQNFANAWESQKIDPEPPFKQPIEIQVSPDSPVSQSHHPAPIDALEEVREYSEKIPLGRPAVQAALPFSLLVEGHLSPQEKEKLLDIINRHDMGIRELDLEPQLDEGRILIPRISEYAGVLLVQALKSSAAKMRLGPSDKIFLSSQTEPDHLHLGSQEIKVTSSVVPTHPAERVVLTSQSHLPNLEHFLVVDLVTASAAIRSGAVEAELSTEYQDTLEALQRELKFKAFRKGATAVINFNAQLTALSPPTHYRLMVMGSAVRERMTPLG